jgi:hypothetical protein
MFARACGTRSSKERKLAWLDRNNGLVWYAVISASVSVSDIAYGPTAHSDTAKADVNKYGLKRRIDILTSGFCSEKAR